MLSERMKSLPPGGTTSVNQLVIADLNQLDTAVLRGDLRSTYGFSTLIFPISNLVTVRGISSISCKDSPSVVSKLLPTRIVSISSISTSCTKFNSVPSSTFIFISIVPMSKVTSPQPLYYNPHHFQLQLSFHSHPSRKHKARALFLAS